MRKSIRVKATFRHVRAVYLDGKGNLVDPDVTHTIDPRTETAGANVVFDQGTNFHFEWDDIPSDIGEAATPDLLAMARSPRIGVALRTGQLPGRPTILAAQQAFSEAAPDLGRCFVRAANDKGRTIIVGVLRFQRRAPTRSSISAECSESSTRWWPSRAPQTVDSRKPSCSTWTRGKRATERHSVEHHFCGLRRCSLARIAPAAVLHTLTGPCLPHSPTGITRSRWDEEPRASPPRPPADGSITSLRISSKRHAQRISLFCAGNETSLLYTPANASSAVGA